MKVEVVRGNRGDFLRFLERNPLRNAFALHDLREEAERVQCFAATDGGAFRGYLLTWRGRQHPNVIISGTEEAALTLLPEAPPSPCTFLVRPPLVEVVDGGRDVSTPLLMDFMVVRLGSFRPVETREAEPLGREDADAIRALYDETIEEERDWGQWAGQGIAYGIRREGRLVTVAGTHFVSRDTSLIGGVYTSPAFRRRGYAATVTSAVTREALRQSGQVGLMVVSTNRGAVALYERLGYQPAVQWAWLDSGTGHTPLA